MRKIIVLEFISLDGVYQAPGGPKEDTSGGFKFGGWTAPLSDKFSGQEMGKQMSGKYDLLLGRKTFKIFESYWPHHTDFWPQVNKINKYVVSKSLKSSEWENTKILRGVEDVKKLRQSNGVPLQIYGSGELVQTLLKNDLADELWLKIFPVTLGKGKKLFAQGTIPAAFKLTYSAVSPTGVIFANYKRNGKVKTGSMA
jgi:dihydrofolate reductase